MAPALLKYAYIRLCQEGEAVCDLLHIDLTPAEPWSPAYHPAEISHPRIRFPKRERLREASAAGRNTHDVIRTCRTQTKYFSLSAPSGGLACGRAPPMMRGRANTESRIHANLCRSGGAGWPLLREPYGSGSAIARLQTMSR